MHLRLCNSTNVPIQRGIVLAPLLRRRVIFETRSSTARAHGPPFRQRVWEGTLWKRWFDLEEPWEQHAAFRNPRCRQAQAICWSERFVRLALALIFWEPDAQLNSASLMFGLSQRTYLRGISRCRRPSRRLLSSAKMHLGQPFEEEKLPWYAADQFYPVRIGEVLDSRYKVLGKLGYGAHSTSWLCQSIRYARRKSYLCCSMFELNASKEMLVLSP